MRPLCFAVLIALLGGTILFADTPQQVKARAQAGDAEAQYRFAQMLEMGSGVEHNVLAAIEWYERAASHGHPESMRRLGILYYNGGVLGESIQADPRRAWLWFTFATAYGQPSAVADAERIAKDLPPESLRELEVEAAERLISGNLVPTGVDRTMKVAADLPPGRLPEVKVHAAESLPSGKLAPNISKAIELYRSAAQDGSTDAAERLAQLYMEGTKVPRDLAQATEWYERAAAEGSRRALFSLAGIAESANPPDLVRALELYSRAAHKADGPSMYRLGRMYAEGKGVTRDVVLADAWLMVAGYFDVPEARASRAELEAELTREQVQRAQREAHSLIASIQQ